MISSAADPTQEVVAGVAAVLDLVEADQGAGQGAGASVAAGAGAGAPVAIGADQPVQLRDQDHARILALNPEHQIKMALQAGMNRGNSQIMKIKYRTSEYPHKRWHQISTLTISA